MSQLLKPERLEPVLHNNRSLCKNSAHLLPLEKSPHSNEDSAQQKTKQLIKLIIINSLYVNLYNILSKMKKLVGRVTLFQNFENLFNVQLYRKLVDFRICFYIVS